MALSQPEMVKLYFMSDSKEAVKTWEECKKAQEEWDKWSKQNKVDHEQLHDAIKNLVVNSIYLSNKLEDTLPQGTDEEKVKQLLSKEYDSDLTVGSDSGSVGADMTVGGRQLLQHLITFKLLCQEQGDKKTLPDLTEEIIQRAHFIMMQGLKTEQGETVNAGSYRKISVRSDRLVYPPYECIPANMTKIVEEYNRKIVSVTRHVSIGELASL